MSIVNLPQSSFDPFVIAPPEPMKRWTVPEYHELIRLGVLTENDPYELIEGWLFTKMTKGSTHDSSVSYLTIAIVTALPAGWICRIQCALTLPDGEPEPDFAIVRGPVSRYDLGHPKPEDVAILIETSSSSLERDRTIKLRSYARAGIPEYWIVNVIDKQIEVYARPVTTGVEEPTYADSQVFGFGSEVPLLIDGQELTRISVAEACRPRR